MRSGESRHLRKTIAAEPQTTGSAKRVDRNRAFLSKHASPRSGVLNRRSESTAFTARSRNVPRVARFHTGAWSPSAPGSAGESAFETICGRCGYCLIRRSPRPSRAAIAAGDKPLAFSAVAARIRACAACRSRDVAGSGPADITNATKVRQSQGEIGGGARDGAIEMGEGLQTAHVSFRTDLALRDGRDGQARSFHCPDAPCPP
jgi:hypothetical protein